MRLWPPRPADGAWTTRVTVTWELWPGVYRWEGALRLACGGKSVV